MTKEALKLALEALDNLMYWDNGKSDYDDAREAIIVIKEALAQPEQEHFLVATIGNWGRVEWADGVFPSLGDKMYSAPPQRTWVGLTDEQIYADAFEQGVHEGSAKAMYSCRNDYFNARAIEAKLKEKNT